MMNLLSKLKYYLSPKRKQCKYCGKTFYKTFDFEENGVNFSLSPCCFEGHVEV
jgi:hypothetical protein